MATDLNEDAVVVEKPRWNVYTMMLLLSLLAIILACVLLWMELKHYEHDYTAEHALSAATPQSVESKGTAVRTLT